MTQWEAPPFRGPLEPALVKPTKHEGLGVNDLGMHTRHSGDSPVGGPSHRASGAGARGTTPAAPRPRLRYVPRAGQDATGYIHGTRARNR